MTAAENLHRIWRMGATPTPREICADITTEAELEQYRIGLRARGALTDEASGAIARRRIELQRAKGVRGSDRPEDAQ